MPRTPRSHRSTYIVVCEGVVHQVTGTSLINAARRFAQSQFSRRYWAGVLENNGDSQRCRAFYSPAGGGCRFRGPVFDVRGTADTPASGRSSSAHSQCRAD